jgi:predicted NBD/HSP70 family sugar kinase
MDAFDDVVTALAGSVVHGLTHARVLRAIARHTAAGVRRDLAQELQVSPGTVSKAVLLAKEQGLVEEREPVALRPGRPLVPLSLSPARYAMIGVAIIAGAERPSHLLGTLIGLDGTPFDGFKHPRKYDLKDDDDLSGTLLLNQLDEFIRSLIADFEGLSMAWPDSDRRPRLLGCGLNLSGHVDHDNGIVRSTGWGESTDEWANRDFGPELQKRLGVTVTCDNDVSSLAVRLNLRPREENEDPGDNYALLSVLDYGVGGALVFHDRTRRGYDSMAGEAGHIPVGHVIQAQPDDDNEQPWTPDDVPHCHCEDPEEGSARGHVQAFAAPDSIIARAKAMQLVEGAGPDLLAQLSARPRADRAVSRIFYQGGVALGRSIVSAINWINPGQIVLYLPPALAEKNHYLAGNCYQLGLTTEIAQSAFSVDYSDRLITKSVPEGEMKERLAAAAAYLVLGNLLEKIAEHPRGR